MSRLTKLSRISSDLPLLIWYDYLKLICSNEKIKNHKSKSILHRDSFWNLLTFLLKKRHLISKSLFFQFKTFFLLVLLLLTGLKHIFYIIFYDYINIPTTYITLISVPSNFTDCECDDLFCLYLSIMHGVFNKVMWKYDEIKKQWLKVLKIMFYNVHKNKVVAFYFLLRSYVVYRQLFKRLRVYWIRKNLQYSFLAIRQVSHDEKKPCVIEKETLGKN